MPKKRNQAERDAAKAKRQAAAEAKRAKAAERRATLEAEAAIKAEERAEEQAPAAQRRDRLAVATALALDSHPRQFGPATKAEVDSAMVTAIRTGAERDPKRGGFRRISVIWNLHQRSPRDITGAHLKAAAQLTRDYEIGHEGAASGGGGGEGATFSGPGDAQLGAIERYRDAMLALGPALSSIVVAVVLLNWTVAEVAGRWQTSPDRAFGRLASAMDRLCDHYAPEGRTRPVRLPEGAPLDPEVTDIPSERLGRHARPQGRERASEIAA